MSLHGQKPVIRRVVLVSGGLRTVLSQTCLVAKLAKYFTLDEATAHLGGLFESLSHSSKLLERLVHFNALFLHLLLPLHQLFLLGSNSLGFTVQLGLHLLEIALLMLDLLVLILNLFLDLVN